MSTDGSTATLLAALLKLRAELSGAALGLEIPGAQDGRDARQALVTQLDDYVLPRLVQQDAPLLAVVGGSTGAGKSTLVNSLIGRAVTESGVLRPTTRSAVLVHHPDDAEWFQPDRILPDLARTASQTNDARSLTLVAAHTVPRGLAILDAPDVDSVEESNRRLAGELLAAADLWLFVTSAARYADQVPWDYLREAADRSAAVAIVLDRTSTESMGEVRGHLARMLTARGLKDSPLFTVLESSVDSEGLLPPSAVAPILSWLHDLAGDPEVRAAVVAQTLDGAVRKIVFAAFDVADLVAEQGAVTASLVEDVDRAYTGAEAAFDKSVSDGTLMHGELAARWRDFVGGDMGRGVDDRMGRIRDRIVDSVRGRRTRVAEVQQALATNVELLLLEQAEAGAHAAYQAWEENQAGAALLRGGDRELERATRTVRARAERVSQDWVEACTEIVRSTGSERKTSARFLALGTHGAAITLAVAVLNELATREDAHHSGGAAARDLLAETFGDSSEHLLQTAKEDLLRRAGTVLVGERQRFYDALSRTAASPDAAASIRSAARSAEDARHRDLIPDDWDNLT
ncbi:dynamin family protein [Mumia flava]|uniref:Dynamin family protein n=1 Tax=Mumia flava TaxID=1348852 RepID=A0A2M9B8C2_9ACTN|nr:dynamin family protein [Mumia flava]PJJ54192.1 dynamin family protein [Mumia flava]